MRTLPTSLIPGVKNKVSFHWSSWFSFDDKNWVGAVLVLRTLSALHIAPNILDRTAHSTSTNSARKIIFLRTSSDPILAMFNINFFLLKLKKKKLKKIFLNNRAIVYLVVSLAPRLLSPRTKSRHFCKTFITRLCGSRFFGKRKAG